MHSALSLTLTDDLPHTLTDTLPKALAALGTDLIRLARCLTGNESEAQDLVQETLLRLWRRREDLAEVEDLRAYARAALRNLYRQGMRRAPLLALEDAPELAADPVVFADMAMRHLQGAIARLPADQSHLIRLVASGETSPAALARLTGWRLGTVMSRLARARAQLRRDMGLSPATPVQELL
ncbi:RNA polymerase sigma factor [Rhodobacteraceae bacterium KMM 6894]|nr:RNA polymerase sigma factor [Rhodobacteraceae bacterium KMM 6894]